MQSVGMVIKKAIMNSLFAIMSGMSKLFCSRSLYKTPEMAESATSICSYFFGKEEDEQNEAKEVNGAM